MNVKLHYISDNNHRSTRTDAADEKKSIDFNKTTFNDVFITFSSLFKNHSALNEKNELLFHWFVCVA